MSGAGRTLGKAIILFIVLTTIFSGCTGRKPQSLSFEYVEGSTAETKFYAIQSVTGRGVGESVHIPTEHNGYPVTYILDRAFFNCKMKSVSMETIAFIYPEAFWNCAYLESLELGSVEVIHREAFANCRSLTSVIIPASCKQIDGGAFINCEKLSAVYFVGIPEEIGPQAFDEGVTIYGIENSKVEEYAKENGFAFVKWDHATLGQEDG